MATNWATRTCDNLEALRGVIGSSDDETMSQFHVFGYATKGDGGERFFFWSKTSLLDDDDSLVIKPDDILPDSPGRWIAAGGKLVFTREDNPITYGAITESFMNSQYSDHAIWSQVLFVNVTDFDGGAIHVIKYDVDKWAQTQTYNKLT